VFDAYGFHMHRSLPPVLGSTGSRQKYQILKQYYTCHASSNIREKGPTKHMSTQTGEGFQQEVSDHFVTFLAHSKNPSVTHDTYKDFRKF
jgi:hypothetical protein